MNDSLALDSPTLATVLGIAAQCPYVAGDAVYYARALYAQYVDTIFFDDDVLCSPDTSSDRMLLISTPQTDTITSKTAGNEFVKVFPNPARELINLAYYATTTGQVQFELRNQLGQVVLNRELNSEQLMAQFSTLDLSTGLYYWQLKDNQRTIKTGKVVIIR